MTVPSPLERQVRRNTNDVVAVYELLHGIDRKISALDAAMSTVVGTQLRHGQRLDVIDDKLEQVSGELADTRIKIEQVSGELAETRIEMNAKFDQVLELLRGQ
jgi:hypothetical protein